MKTNIINNAMKMADQINQNKLLLNPGQVINAQVIKSAGNHVLIQYGSYLFKAQTDLALKNGTRLKLVVETGSDETINLRIIGEKAVKPPPTNPPLNPGSISVPSLDTVVRQLTKFNLPISLELIADLNRFLKKNQLSEDIGQLILWLKSVGIKVDSKGDIKALLALHKFFQGLFSIDQEPRFFSLINESENQNMAGVNIYNWALGQHHVYLIKSGSKRELVLPENCQLAIRLDSVALQELWFVIELANHTLTVNIICTQEKYKNILEKEVVDLRRAMEKTGYVINNLTIRVEPGPTTIFDLLPEQEIRNVNLQV